MLRVTTLYASSAVATAAYYTRYLADAPGEEPGRWLGRQADRLDLAGPVDADELQRLLEGRDPTSGVGLGRELRDRTTTDGRVVKAVAGFDATFSAPKSLSVWWALTSDPGLLEAHDIAVTAALEHLERYGSTTRIRHQGRRLHPDTLGLTMATFRQTTSRADDPQLHTHAVISAKVQTDDGRWLALDARFLKRHQRMLGGLYQSVLRAELTHRYGIAWGPVVNGQAEIVGAPAELLEAFSKRTVQVDHALAGKVGEFRGREGRDPSRWERAAMEREAAADTRQRKTGRSVVDLQRRWADEARELGWTAGRFTEGLTVAGHKHPAPTPLTVDHVLDQLSTICSAWTRADVMRAVCDLAPAPTAAPTAMLGRAWAATLERVTDDVLARCVNLDPDNDSRRRSSDGRSVWQEPTSPHWTCQAILAEEELILTWAMGAQVEEPMPSRTVDGDRLDVLQATAAGAVAGHDRLVAVVGPAGTGKTTMLAAAVEDLGRHGRVVFGVAPTAKAAHVLAVEMGMETDTLAKLLHEWRRGDRLPDHQYRLPTGTTVVVDEASMVGTGSLHQLIRLAESADWRLVLVGDSRQLQAVGRGGMFAELCATSRVHELVRIHRFTHPWEAEASLLLRAGEPAALDTYEEHGRIEPGTLAEHLDEIAADWLSLTREGRTVAVTASSNQHVDALNNSIQCARLDAGQLEPGTAVPIAGGERAHVGETVVTRRNDRRLVTSSGETVRNRDIWTVTATHPDGSLTVTPHGGGTISLPAEYLTGHVRLGYAATEHGHQGDTVDIGIALTSVATTHRGLYVATTRGRDENRIHVITEDDDLTEARDILDGVLAHDRADLPAVTQRRHLAAAEAQPARPQPKPIVPDWLEPWRQRLHDRRQSLVDGLKERELRRFDAVGELETLQPAIAAARGAWQPYAGPIRDLERKLETELRPAMWSAHHDARQAGFGLRRSTARHAADAREAVQQAQAAIAAIQADGASVKEGLDHLQRRAAELRGRAEPIDRLDTVDRNEIRQLDQILDAADTYTDWLEGRPTPTARLAHAVDTLTAVAKSAPSFARRIGEVEKTQWFQLLELAPDHLSQEPARRPTPEIELGR
jgi:conjugative relaxase-like TrwC/TraI family protein